LKNITGYPGGLDLATEIAKEWEQAFPRRSAMLDELEQAGF